MSRIIKLDGPPLLPPDWNQEYAWRVHTHTEGDPEFEWSEDRVKLALFSENYGSVVHGREVIERSAFLGAPLNVSALSHLLLNPELIFDSWSSDEMRLGPPLNDTTRAIHFLGTIFRDREGHELVLAMKLMGDGKWRWVFSFADGDWATWATAVAYAVP